MRLSENKPVQMKCTDGLWEFFLPERAEAVLAAGSLTRSSLSHSMTTGHHLFNELFIRLLLQRPCYRKERFRELWLNSQTSGSPTKALSCFGCRVHINIVMPINAMKGKNKSNLIS